MVGIQRYRFFKCTLHFGNKKELPNESSPLCLLRESEAKHVKELSIHGLQGSRLLQMLHGAIRIEKLLHQEESSKKIVRVRVTRLVPQHSRKRLFCLSKAFL